eukprot:8900514-Alexandrium_andersonii.AAC.1
MRRRSADDGARMCGRACRKVVLARARAPHACRLEASAGPSVAPFGSGRGPSEGCSCVKALALRETREAAQAL